MQLRIRSVDVQLPSDDMAAVERSVRTTLGRHMPGIEQARVTLSAAAIARLHCEIRVQMRPGEHLVVENETSDLHEAVAGAAQRLVRQLDRRRGLAMDHAPERRADRR